MKETWIEVALNGPWGKKRQPRMPIAVSDIVEQAVACADAGRRHRALPCL